MGSYKIEWKRSAIKELRGLPKDSLSRILEAAYCCLLQPGGIIPGQKFCGGNSFAKLQQTVTHRSVESSLSLLPKESPHLGAV
jgi:mRNA-degrading endonuclease RelE of RelBE toxin-antitoxin system